MYKGSVAFGAGRGYRDGVRNVEVMVESLSGGSRPEIQEEGRVMELKQTTADCSDEGCLSSTCTEC